jgi:hypothetical protein
VGDWDSPGASWEEARAQGQLWSPISEKLRDSPGASRAEARRVGGRDSPGASLGTVVVSDIGDAQGQSRREQGRGAPRGRLGESWRELGRGAPRGRLGTVPARAGRRREHRDSPGASREEARGVRA